MGVLKVVWEIKVEEEVPPTPPPTPVPSWIYALPLIGAILLAIAKRR